MQATVELLDLKPSAIEHIDRPLFDQTKGQLNFEAARKLLELDAEPCEAILIVEFMMTMWPNGSRPSPRGSLGCAR